jgi:tryptophan-rich sensory protein
MKNIIRNGFYLFFPLIIGGIVAFLTINNIDYSSLNQPPLSPPKIIFPIVWTILYLLIGISYYNYRKDNNDDLDKIIYYFSLFLNAMWSVIFFVWKFRFIAIIWIIILDLLVYYLIALFKEKNKVSAYLLIPYLIWILFATYLTTGIYFLN